VSRTPQTVRRPAVRVYGLPRPETVQLPPSRQYRLGPLAVDASHGRDSSESRTPRDFAPVNRVGSETLHALHRRSGRAGGPHGRTEHQTLVYSQPVAPIGHRGSGDQDGQPSRHGPVLARLTIG
jgi:hypothetical protein